MQSIKFCFAPLRCTYIKRQCPWIRYPDLVKSLAAYLIAFSFLIVPWGRELIVPDVRYLVLLPASILWNDTGKSVGAMIKSTVLFCLSVTGCTALSWFLLFVVQPFSIALVVLFFFATVAGLAVLKARYPDVWTISSNVGISLLIFQITNGHYDYSLTGTVSAVRLFSYYKVYLAGALISLLCNLFIFPRWASQQLRLGLISGLEDVQSLLSLVTRSIVESSSNMTHLTDANARVRRERGPHTSPSLSYFRMSLEERLARQAELKMALKKCRFGFSRISNALEESRLEVAYFEHDPAVYESLTSLVRRMLRHLSLIGTASLILLMYDGEAPANASSRAADAESMTSSRASLFSTWSYSQPHESSLLIKWIAVMMGPLQSLSAQCLREIDQILALLDPKERTRFMANHVSDVERQPLLAVSEKSLSSPHRMLRPSFSDRLTRVDTHPTDIPDLAQADASNSLALAIDTFNSHLALFLLSTLHAPEGSEAHPMTSLSQAQLDQLHSDTAEEIKLSCGLENAFTIDPPSVLEQGLFIYSYNLGIAQFASTLSLWRNIEHLRALEKSSKRKFHVPFITRIRRFFRSHPANLQDEEFAERLRSSPHPFRSDSACCHSDNQGGNSANADTELSPSAPPEETRPLEPSSRVISFSALMKAMHLLLEHMTVSILGLTSAIRSMRDFQYGLRLAFVVTFWTLFGMFDDTRDTFHAWRGQWAVITMAVVMTPTVGSAFSLGLYRFLGTLLGGLWACFCWTLFASDTGDTLMERILLALSALTWAVPCLVARQHPKMRRLGIVSLMAFTIVLFGAHVQKLTQDSDEPDRLLPNPSPPHGFPLLSIYKIAFQRCSMISIGVLLSIVFTALLFPNFARTALRCDLGALIHQMGYLYHLLFKSSTTEKPILTPSQVKEFWIPFEFQLQSSLIQVARWMAACESEWFLQLEGSPDDPLGFRKTLTKEAGSLALQQVYERMLELWQRVLDRLLMMRLLISHIQSAETGDVARPSFKQLQGTLSLQSPFESLISEIRITFYHLSTSLYAKLPCPPPSSLEGKKAYWYRDLFLSFQEHQASRTETRSPCLAALGAKPPINLWIQLALTSVSQDLKSLESLTVAALGRIE